ncbi:chlororespiratory reduction protein 7 [Myxacorys almedinensis]|uniref:Chlororespiratory reduction protein 7 n=1 Tax=Myxacorys almedinensis A TaxID=2690445 RepID=A0A8J7Z5K6_9CYAN|nr:chlororespiratory reduction protein 7 [Myxacorys almedinensis]NDJ15900.1 chlororespiratory reduction protein 7 [Myxacorys almedinensis A]
MPNSLMYQEDYFVVLETNQPEQILSVEELGQKLRSRLSSHPDDLPIDLQQFATVDEQVTYLINTTYELDLAPGQYLQWYAVRLEK